MHAQKSIGILICSALTLSVITGCGNNTANQNTSENGAETEIATEAPYKYDEVVFYQTPSCKMTFKGIEIKSDYVRNLDYLDFSFCAENTGNDKIDYESYGYIINGYVLYPSVSGYAAFSLEPGTKKICHVELSKEKFDEAEIDKIETIEFDHKNIEIGNIYSDDYELEQLTGNGLTLDPPFELNWEKIE